MHTERKTVTITIRPPTEEDRSDWDRLYQGYADFYKIPQSAEMRDKVWGWLMDAEHEVRCLVAEHDGAVVGLTHFRPFSSPLRAITNCFLDDIFVDPDHRGSGAARALIEAVQEQAKTNGWGVVRWITDDDNYRGRGLYDKLATRTMWITYDVKI